MWPVRRRLVLVFPGCRSDAIHDAFKHDDFSAARLGQFQAKLDKGIESMRKLVYAFYNEGFSFSQFLKKYPDERVNVISLLIGDVFKEGVDNVYGPMSDFADIPPTLWEQLAQMEDGGAAMLFDEKAALSAQYQYYDDRASKAEAQTA